MGEGTKRFDDLPCGRCDAGIYSETPVLIGLEMFGACETAKQALASAPMCKCDPSHICFGARDWIVGQTFPISESEKAQILELCA